MNQLNTIIVDDEEFARSSLYFLLQENCPNINICGIAKSVNEARTLLQNHNIDLIFLDIAMPGENGFSLIPQVQEANATVIFTTAYDQYALKAIKANAIDYLLKPINIDELKEAVQKAEKHLANRLDGAHTHLFYQNLETTLEQTNIQRITLPGGQSHRIIEVEDIVHIDADSNYSIFHFNSDEKITVSKVLKEYEEILPNDKFVRVHKSSIVNLKYVKEYAHKNNGLILLLSNGTSIAVSRRRASDFFEKIKNYQSAK